MPSVAPSSPWYHRSWVVTLASVVLPPVGCALVWTRRWRGWKSAVLRPLATIGMVGISLVHLFLFFGLRVELDGSGFRPIFTFRSSARDVERLEAHRAAQRTQTPPTASSASERGATPSAQATGSPDNAGVDRRVGTNQPGEQRTADTAAPSTGPLSLARPYWTQFRGPNRDGVYSERAVLSSWPANGPPLLWRQPVGGGYASFAVADGRAFTIEQRRTNEVVAAYDVQSGRELWTNSWTAFFQEPMGGDGPRATPTWQDGRVFALGAAGELRALDAATGRTLWRTNILEQHGARNLTWGMAASPLVVDGKVIVVPGGPGASVVAYAASTGAVVWKSLGDAQSYTSPIIATLAGQRQLVVVSAERAMGLTLDGGALLWEYPWVTQYGANVAQPMILDEGHFFISAGYDHGSALVEVTRTEGGFQAREIWKNKNMKNRFSSAVLHEGAVYGFDEGILACVDARTGERRWKGGRYGYGQLLLAGGNLIAVTEEGDLALVRATPETFEEIARVAALEGKTWNVPAIADGVLLVRNGREMAAYRVSR
jgi:outer membrane protein assembly factor BamB